ncbi:MAG TPA: DUF3558 family protein [Pseudonocardiaceae bacterium]
MIPAFALALVGVMGLSGCAAVGATVAAGGFAAYLAESNGAPQVTHPLDATEALQAPCTSLSTGDVEGVGAQNVLAGMPSTTDGIPTCYWEGTNTVRVAVGWMLDNKDGLSYLYYRQSQMAYWIPTTVSGYPAVFADVEDDRSDGRCIINVAVSDSLYFATMYASGSRGMACYLAQQAATDVIKNLGGA